MYYRQRARAAVHSAASRFVLRDSLRSSHWPVSLTTLLGTLCCVPLGAQRRKVLKVVDFLSGGLLELRWIKTSLTVPSDRVAAASFVRAFVTLQQC